VNLDRVECAECGELIIALVEEDWEEQHCPVCGAWLDPEDYADGS
jgi:hypothetical protein